MNVLMIVALVWWLELGVNGAVISLVAGHAFVIFVGLADLRRHCRLTLEVPSPSVFKRILGYGLREHVAKVTHAIDARIGSLLLGLVAGRSDIGLFAAGSALMSRMVVIPDAVSISLLPRVARGDNGRAELTAFCARVCWWLTAAIFAVWVVVSTPVTRILLSEAFLPVVPLTWIMGLGFVVYSGTDVFMAFFRGINRPGVCSWAMWLGLCANVVSFFPLYAALGLEGMAWAMTLGLICRSVYLVWMFRRTSGVVLSAALLPRRGDISYMRDAGRSIVGRMRGFPNESP